MTVEFVSKISPAVNKTNKTGELECNELDITSCLDLQKENLTESINGKSNQSSIVNIANDDIFAFGDDEVLHFFKAERSINFSIEATGQSLSEEQFISVIFQRDSIRFWDVIFHQTFDFAEENICLFCRRTRKRFRWSHERIFNFVNEKNASNSRYVFW